MLLGAEGLLRLAGCGYAPGFFLERPIAGGTVWSDNPDFGRRFFPAGLQRAAKPFRFPAGKPPGTVRIFVLGESAAMGDPDLKFGLPKMLEVLLRARDPEKRVEVINTAMVAINSHVIVPIARDCADKQADLWVVYMGNNEMVGPFGAASVFGARAPAWPVVRLGLWLKRTRLGQLADAALNRIRRGAGPTPDWTGMELMARQRVSHASAATRQVYRNFERNLADVLQAGSAAGVPVVLCTVGSNLRDCAPFASLHRSGLGSNELREWQAAYDSGAACQARGEASNALAFFAQAERLDADFADLSFRQGQCALLLGRDREAADLLQRARDQDALQFRADDVINQTLRRAAAAFQKQGVNLVDAERLLATNSPDGLSGAEYFYEHVHLTPEGNYLLARAIADQAARILGLSSAGAWVSPAECFGELGLTDWNRYDALTTILDRIQAPPFTFQLDHAHRVEALHEQLARYRPASKPAQVRRQAAEVAARVRQEPDDVDLRWNLAVLLQMSGDAKGTEEQWRALMQLQPQSILPPFNLARLMEDLGRPGEAASLYNRCLSLNSGYYPARYSLGRVLVEAGRGSEAVRHLSRAARQKPQSVEAHLALGEALSQAHRPEQAEQQWREVLRLDPQNQAARERLSSPAYSGR